MGKYSRSCRNLDLDQTILNVKLDRFIYYNNYVKISSCLTHKFLSYSVHRPILAEHSVVAVYNVQPAVQ